MRSSVILLALLLLLPSCGHESEKGFSTLEISKSQQGADLSEATKGLEVQGLRFTTVGTEGVAFDSAFERQIEWERPFLSYSSRISALKNYVEKSHELTMMFAKNVPADVALKSKLCQDKIKTIQATMKAKGAGNLGIEFLPDMEALIKTEQALQALGVRFGINIGSGTVTMDQDALIVALATAPAVRPQIRKAMADFVQAADNLFKRHGADLASEIIPRKADAVVEALKTL